MGKAKKFACARCGYATIRSVWTRPALAFCDTCKAARREERRTKIMMPCTGCGVEVTVTGWKLAAARAGRGYCSTECRDRVVSALSSARMAATNRRHASKRMKERNPMSDPATRAKVSVTLRKMGWKPTVQGGNGRPMPAAQRLLSEALRWPTEVVVATGERSAERPAAYKIDIAEERLMVGIEVDGNSHSAIERREQDRKKETFLVGLGWLIVRFTNQAVLDDLRACVERVGAAIAERSVEQAERAGTRVNVVTLGSDRRLESQRFDSVRAFLAVSGRNYYGAKIDIGEERLTGPIVAGLSGPAYGGPGTIRYEDAGAYELLSS